MHFIYILDLEDVILSDEGGGNFLAHTVCCYLDGTCSCMVFSPSCVLWCRCTNDSANEVLLDTVHVHHRHCLIGQ